MKQIRIKDESMIGLGIAAEAYLKNYAQKDLIVFRKHSKKEKQTHLDKIKDLLQQDNIEVFKSTKKINDWMPDITIHICEEKVKKKKGHYYLVYQDIKSLFKQNPVQLMEALKKDILIFIGKELK